jgi:hypothetical protein
MVRWRPSSGIGTVREGADAGTTHRLRLAGKNCQREIDVRLFGPSGVATDSSASSPAVGKGMLDAFSRVSDLLGAGMGEGITASLVGGAAPGASSAAFSSSLAGNLGFGGTVGFLPKIGGPIPTCNWVSAEINLYSCV